jgi:tripartite-type tricarboxylate transporter receptor subunit TctC
VTRCVGFIPVRLSIESTTRGDTAALFQLHRRSHRMTFGFHSQRRQVLITAVTMAAGLHLNIAHAQTTWPSKPVRLMVGFPGGSTPDMAARVLAEVLSKAWGQPVVVDNKPGASGNIAADQVAKANDDHTLGVVINGNLTSAKLLNPKLPFDPAQDFTLLSLLATAPLVLVGPATEAGGADFFKAAAAAGDKWNYGSVGIGSVGHLGMELLKSRSELKAQHVPYNGNPAVLTALISGQIQAALVPPGVALPQVRAGKIKAIGLTGGRSTLAPEVAPLSDLGVRLNELEVWVALVGPSNLSKAAQARVARDLPALMREADARQRLFNAGWQMQATSSEALKLRVKAETRLLGDIITQRGIKAE